jgi:hypothetical protein
VVVRFYRKMRLNRVHALRVAWQSPGGIAPPGASPPPVVVRPVIPGSLVVPAEQELPPSGMEAVFYVTPLARGKLPGARLDVAPAQAAPTPVPLRMRSVTQRLTKFLLLLTLIVPPLLFYVTSKEGRLEGMIDRQVPAPARGGGAQTRTIRTPGEPGEVLEKWINDERVVPSVPYVTENVAYGLGTAYDFLYHMAEADPLAFYVGVILLALTVASWLLHLATRGRRRARIALPAPA